MKEKAYLLGLRTGDIHARKSGNLIVPETTSTHAAQLKMFRQSFEKYASTKCYEKKGGLTERINRIYSFLDNSFEFLIEKPDSIPKWILIDENLFYSFLAGYSDCEGSWILTQHKKYNGRWKDLVFSLGTCDKQILKQIHQKLKELGFNAHFYLVRKPNTETTSDLICKLPLYRVMIMNHKDVVKLAQIILPLSKHEEKQKAKLRLINYNKMNIKKKLLKRQKLGTIKIPCIKCKHKKSGKMGIQDIKIKNTIDISAQYVRQNFIKR